MANMSYCRFHNTRRDLEDCLEAIEDGDEISTEEAHDGRLMFLRFLEFCVDYEIIEDFKPNEVTAMFDNITEEE